MDSVRTAPSPNTPDRGLAASFVRWYAVSQPLHIIKHYTQYASALLEAYSFAFLLRTLFAPWKDIKDPYPSKGFNLREIAETLTLNITTRTIGAVIRLCAIVVGALLHLALFLGFALYLVTWLIFPALLAAFIPFTLSLLFT